MPKPFDVVALLSSSAIMSRKAGTYHPETHVIDLAELRQIIWELQRESEQEVVDKKKGRNHLHAPYPPTWAIKRRTDPLRAGRQSRHQKQGAVARKRRRSRNDA